MFHLTLDDFIAARARIAQHIKHTPLLTSQQLDEETGFHTRLKAELFQRVGSYKIRGPLNKFSLMPEAPAPAARLPPGLRHPPVLRCDIDHEMLPLRCSMRFFPRTRCPAINSHVRPPNSLVFAPQAPIRSRSCSI